MIQIDEGNRVFQHRKGEEKTKQVGKLMHNPNVCGAPEKREPFIYINGVCLTADDCSDIASALRAIAGRYQFDENNNRQKTPAK